MKPYLLIFFVLSLNGCIHFGHGRILCREGIPTKQCLHERWVHDYEKGIGGTNMYSKGMQQLNMSNLFLGGHQLGNGNIENGYISNLGACRYYYEFEPKSGVIVGFRFEELKGQYSCRYTGA